MGYGVTRFRNGRSISSRITGYSVRRFWWLRGACPKQQQYHDDKRCGVRPTHRVTLAANR
jgi:hypothetical protein